jgi:hypothetical protein
MIFSFVVNFNNVNATITTITTNATNLRHIVILVNNSTDSGEYDDARRANDAIVFSILVFVTLCYISCTFGHKLKQFQRDSV